MVKPQSSKLITRVRFPSSPRDLGSRRFRVEALSFSLEGMTGIPSACGFVSSRARNPHAPARHPLHKSRSRLPGIAYGRKYIPSRARDFHPPARHPLENYPERICRNPFRTPTTQGTPTTLTSPKNTSLQQNNRRQIRIFASTRIIYRKIRYTYSKVFYFGKEDSVTLKINEKLWKSSYSNRSLQRLRSISMSLTASPQL